MKGTAGQGPPLFPREAVPVFWALMKATLLVSGLRRMNPHSRCIGFLVSGWKALNLRGRSEYQSCCTAALKIQALAWFHLRGNHIAFNHASLPAVLFVE